MKLSFTKNEIIGMDEQMLSAMVNAQKAFVSFIDAYYDKNSSIKQRRYFTLTDNEGYSCEITYRDFTQYVSVIWETYDSFTINSCFKLEKDEQAFLCHFVDILNELDNDDLSFYTYNNCYDEDKINSALSSLFDATEKYYSAIRDIISSKGHTDKIYNAVIDEPIENADLSTDITCYMDIDYYNTLINGFDKALKNAQRKKRRNKEISLFEKRLCRAMDNGAPQAKAYRKSSKKANELSKKDKFVYKLPYAFNIMVIGGLITFLGYKLDNFFFKDTFARGGGELWETLICFAGFLPFALTYSFRFPIYKLLFGKRVVEIKDELTMGKVGDKIIGTLLYAVVVVSLVATCLLGYKGVAFTDNGEIAYKKNAFKNIEIVQLEDTDIAYIEGYYGRHHSFNRYYDTAYAFKLDGEWVDYGIANDDRAEKLIKESIKDKNIKTFKTIEDAK